MRKNFPNRVEARRESAKVRQSIKKTPLEQLQALEDRGQGLCKEARDLRIKHK